jgi:hypothetical protein
MEYTLKLEQQNRFQIVKRLHATAITQCLSMGNYYFKCDLSNFKTLIFHHRCGSIRFDQPGCRIVRNMALAYPGCCGDIVCDEKSKVNDFQGNSIE